MDLEGSGDSTGGCHASLMTFPCWRVTKLASLRVFVREVVSASRRKGCCIALYGHVCTWRAVAGHSQRLLESPVVEPWPTALLTEILVRRCWARHRRLRLCRNDIAVNTFSRSGCGRMFSARGCGGRCCKRHQLIQVSSSSSAWSVQHPAVVTGTAGSADHPGLRPDTAENATAAPEDTSHTGCNVHCPDAAWNIKFDALHVHLPGSHWASRAGAAI
jgi:hypothetical protein